MKRIFLISMVVAAVLLLSVTAMAAVQCKEISATNRQHVDAGRAHRVGVFGCENPGFYALGSEDFLGAMANKVTVLNTKDNGQSFQLGSCPAQGVDEDADGYMVDEDCNDADASIHPQAIEICEDGIDQDCDGSDLQCTGCQQWTTSNDAHVEAKRAYTETTALGCSEEQVSYIAVGSDEALGNSGSTQTTLRTEDGGKTYKNGKCSAAGEDIDQDGYVSDEDCDDYDPHVHPGATDFCGDGIDQDCDGADTKCILPPSCIPNLNDWKVEYAPKQSNCLSCHTTCTYGGINGVHTCLEGQDWGELRCSQCHRNVHN